MYMYLARCACKLLYKNLWSSTHCLCANCEGHNDNESSNSSSHTNNTNNCNNNTSNSSVAIMALSRFSLLGLCALLPLLFAALSERDSKTPTQLQRRTKPECSRVRCSHRRLPVCVGEKLPPLCATHFCFYSVSSDWPQPPSAHWGSAKLGNGNAGCKKNSTY